MPTELINHLNDTEKIQEVLGLMLEGQDEFFIQNHIETNHPLSDPFQLMSAAATEFAKSSQSDPAIVLGWCYQATRMVYQKMLDDGDLAGALKAIKQMADLARKSGVEYVRSKNDSDGSDSEA